MKKRSLLITAIITPIISILSGCGAGVTVYRDQIRIKDPVAPSCNCETEKEKIYAFYTLIGLDRIVEITNKKLNEKTTYIGISPSYPCFVEHPHKGRERIPYSKVIRGSFLREYFMRKSNCECEE